MMARPLVPKRLAARLRGAYQRLEFTQGAIIHSPSRLLQCELEVADFEADPELYARRYYPGHGVDSYPVQTRISRLREDIAHRRRRRPEEVEAWRTAEAETDRVEAEVLAEVQRMRPSEGRVPWPVRPGAAMEREAREALDRIRHEAETTWERVQAYRAQLHQQMDAELAQIDAEFEKEAEAFRAEHRAEIEAMEPAAREAYLARWNAFVQALEEGRVTAVDVIEHLRRRMA